MLLFTLCFCIFHFLCTVSNHESDGRDLVFIIDTDIPDNKLGNLKNRALEVLSVATSHSQNIEKFVLITSQRPRNTSVTSDINVFRKNINQLQTNRNELVKDLLPVIQATVEAASPGSLLYVFRDVINTVYENDSRLWNTCRQKEIQLNFVDSKTSSTHEDDASRKVDRQISDFTPIFLQTVPILLYNAEVSDRSKSTFDVLVKNDISTLTITVTCYKPLVSMKDPDGNRIKLEKLEATHLKQVLRAVSELQGNYKLRVRCRSMGEVAVHGDMDVAVRVGFSTDKPTKITDTHPVFVYDVLNYLAVEMVQTTTDLRIMTSSIVNSKQQVLKDLEMVADRYWKFYVSTPFIPPANFFRIALKIYSSGTGKEITTVIPVTYTGVPLLSAQPPSSTRPIFTMQKPVIDKSINHIEIVQGSRISLKCMATGYPTPKITWNFKTTGSGVRKNLGIHTNVLNFAHIRRKQSGVYVCEAQNSAGFDSHSINLTVYYPPIIINKPSDIFEADAGSEVKLFIEFEANPKPTIEWRFNGKQLTGDGYVMDSGKHLTFTVTSDKEGVYECTVSNEYGSETATTLLIVKGKPEISKCPPSTLQVLMGEMVNLTITYKAYPEAVVTWTFNDKALTGDDVFHIYSSNSITFMATPELTGTYAYTITNEFGSIDGSTYVEVHYPFVDTQEETVLKTVGDNLKLTCPFSFLVRSLKVQWTFVPKGSSMHEILGENSTTLIIPNLNERQSGIYTCSVKGINETKDFVVDIGHAPTIMYRPTEDIRVHNGKWLNITILYDANPTATEVVWYHDQKILNGDESYKISHSTIGFIATSERSGEYKCALINKYGSGNVTLKVHVLEEEQNISKSIGSIVVLCYIHGCTSPVVECSLYGGTDTEVTWSFIPDGSTTPLHLEARDSQLLPNLVKSGDGRYVCNAKSKHSGNTNSSDFVTEYAPVLKHATESYKVDMGKNVILYCDYEAKPEPIVMWMHNDVPIRGSKFTMNSDNSISFTFDENDVGVYECLVSNKLGTAIKTINLTSWTKPFIDKTESVITAVERSSVVLHCTILAGNPTPRISWTFENPDTGETTPLKNETGDIEIYGLQKYHNGQYICTASNKLGSDHHKINLKVEYPPTVSNQNVVVSVQKGKRLDLPCEYEAAPTPEVTWLYYGLPVVGDLHKIHDNHTLSFVAIQNSEYQCRISNKHGTAMKHVEVIVEDAELDKKNTTLVEHPLNMLRVSRETSEEDESTSFEESQSEEESHEVIDVPAISNRDLPKLF